MKSHFAEENEEATFSHDTADDHCWRDHRVGSEHLAAELVVLFLLFLVFITLSANWTIYDARTSASIAPAQEPLPVYFSQGPMTRQQQQIPKDDDR
jgi:hypothetical protein